MRTMSTACPICGLAFAKDEMVKTATVSLPFGLLGISFHETCFLAESTRAYELIEEAIVKAIEIAAKIAGGTLPAPPMIH